MSILKIARTAVAATALAMLPAHAVAQTAAVPAPAVAQLSEENDQSEGLRGYIIPVIIVVILGVGLYFALEDDDNSASA